jgi:CRISPR/Cas system-associated endonuclease Cas3-HD
MSITLHVGGDGDAGKAYQRNFSNAHFFYVFNSLGLGNVFNDYCGGVEAGYKLNFVIQTIHENAMKAIRREDNLLSVEYLLNAILDILRVAYKAQELNEELEWA